MMHLRRLRVLVAVGLASLSVAAAPASHAAASGGTYTVRPNDTLSGIALSAGTTVSTLMSLNRLQDANRLAVGQVLVLPTTASPDVTGSSSSNTTAAGPAVLVYIVRGGDTLSGIAARFGVSLDALGTANSLPDWCVLSIGQRLVVPSATAAPAPQAESNVAPAAVAASSLPTSGAGIDAILAQQAINAGVPVSLVKAVAWQESGWQMVTAADGGIGVMQLMPSAVDWVSTSLLGVKINPYDPTDNIRGGVTMLRYFLHVFSGDARQALAAYHQGLASVQSQGISAECARYIANVLALQTRFGG